MPVPHGVVPHVVVCGAGLTGLATAWHLRQRGLDVTVLEASDRAGGVVQTNVRDGFLVEHGPNSCMLTAPMAQLIDALGLTAQLRQAAPFAKRRFIVRGGRPLEVPMSPAAMLRSPLFGAAAKLRVLGEPFVPRRTDAGDESVADFVRRRLGAEPLAWAVDPFVSGVYAGDPAQLSVRHAFPRLAALEREHGSLVRGMIAGARRARGSGSARSHATMISFRDGMATLPRALADDLGPGMIRCGSRVTAIAPLGTGLEVIVVRGGATERLTADAVVSTLPLHALSGVSLPAAGRAALVQLGTVAHPPVVSLALGFRRADVVHALDGFGCLIPSAEQRDTLGVLFSSTLFEGRAPSDQVLLTCFIGGTRRPELAALDTDALVRLVVPELRALFGVTGEPTFVQRTTWPRAIPQYAPGHDAALEAAEALERTLPGLVMDGQFRRGVSVGDCIAAGDTIAARVADGLATLPAPPRGRQPAAPDTPPRFVEPPGLLLPTAG